MIYSRMRHLEQDECDLDVTSLMLIFLRGIVLLHNDQHRCMYQKIESSTSDGADTTRSVILTLPL